MSSSASKLFPLSVAAFRCCLGVVTCHSRPSAHFSSAIYVGWRLYFAFSGLTVISLAVGSLASCEVVIGSMVGAATRGTIGR